MKNLKVRDIMSTPVHHVSPRLNLVDLERELMSNRISGAPVVEHGKVVGVVSRSDVDRALSRERSKAAAAAAYFYSTDFSEEPGSSRSADPTGSALESLRALLVKDVMAQNVISVSGSDAIAHAAQLMHAKRIHRVLVIEDGALEGLVSALDIVGAVAEDSAK